MAFTDISTVMWHVSAILIATIILQLRTQCLANRFRDYNNIHKYDRTFHNRKDKVEYLGEILKKYVDALRKTSNGQVELVFLVDSSTSVGMTDFDNELAFVKKLLADFTVDKDTTRVAVITFSSRSRIIREIDHLSHPDNDHHKCSLLEEELPRIAYRGGSTHTIDAFREAQVGPLTVFNRDLVYSKRLERTVSLVSLVY